MSEQSCREYLNNYHLSIFTRLICLRYWLKALHHAAVVAAAQPRNDENWDSTRRLSIVQQQLDQLVLLKRKRRKE